MFGLKNIIQSFKERHRAFGAARSGQWPKVRNEFLKSHPVCEVCGGTKDLVAHHKLPFHKFPDLELDLKNLTTLCSKDHLRIGHLDSFQSWNKTIDEDIKYWYDKILHRP